jgi:hypothetical protein
MSTIPELSSTSPSSTFVVSSGMEINTPPKIKEIVAEDTQRVEGDIGETKSSITTITAKQPVDNTNHPDWIKWYDYEINQCTKAVHDCISKMDSESILVMTNKNHTATMNDIVFHLPPHFPVMISPNEKEFTSANVLSLRRIIVQREYYDTVLIITDNAKKKIIHKPIPKTETKDEYEIPTSHGKIFWSLLLPEEAKQTTYQHLSKGDVRGGVKVIKEALDVVMKVPVRYRFQGYMKLFNDEQKESIIKCIETGDNDHATLRDLVKKALDTIDMMDILTNDEHNHMNWPGVHSDQIQQLSNCSTFNYSGWGRGSRQSNVKIDVAGALAIVKSALDHANLIEIMRPEIQFVTYWDNCFSKEQKAMILSSGDPSTIINTAKGFMETVDIKHASTKTRNDGYFGTTAECFYNCSCLACFVMRSITSISDPWIGPRYRRSYPPAKHDRSDDNLRNEPVNYNYPFGLDLKDLIAAFKAMPDHLHYVPKDPIKSLLLTGESRSSGLYAVTGCVYGAVTTMYNHDRWHGYEGAFSGGGYIKGKSEQESASDIDKYLQDYRDALVVARSSSSTSSPIVPVEALSTFASN